MVTIDKYVRPAMMRRRAAATRATPGKLHGLARASEAVAGVLIAMAIAPLGCGEAAEAIALPVGRAEVRRSGEIVLAGCPSRDPIDTLESYTLTTPTGSCNSGAPTCEVRTQQWCKGGLRGPTVEWRCQCDEGKWNCRNPSSGMQYCPTLPNAAPPGDSHLCAYDPARKQGIECPVDSAVCEMTTIQQCPSGGQGRTSRWKCTCDTYPMLAPGVRVWGCERQRSENQFCATNTCPVVLSYSVTPSRASVAQRIELRATARDDDGDDLTMEWSTSLGRFVNPYAANTSYTCSVVGKAKLSVVASDGVCETAVNVDVDCMP